MKKLYIIFAMAFAQLMQSQTVPQAFNYQGIARDAQGISMPSKQLGIKITLQEKSGNTTTDVYAETHTVTTSSTGLFNIAIGRGTASIGTFSNVNFSNKNISVKTEIDPNGGTSYSLSGTSELLSVPYALVAGNSTTSPSSDVWTKDNSNNYVFVNKGEKVGIGTVTPKYKLHIATNSSGVDRSFMVLNNTNTGNDATTGLTLITGNDESDHISLGITGPNYTLTPNSASLANISSKFLSFDAKHIDGHFRFLTGGTYGINESTEKMRLISNGYLGIGTSTPEFKLHLYGKSTNDSYALIEATGTDNNVSAGYQIKVAGKTIGDIRGTGYNYFPSLYPGYLIMNGVANGVMLSAWNSNEAKRGDIRFKTGSPSLDSAPIDRAIITGDGNLGIGTTTPETILHVSGDKGNNSYSMIESTSLSNNATAGHIIKVGGKRIGDLRATGYNYFPSLNPGYLMLNGVSNGILLRSWNENESKRGDIRFQTGSPSLDTAPIDRAIITGDGNFGIGTTTPKSKVQVSDGDVYIDNSANGIIMKSPNGQCWRVTVDNTGSFKSTALTSCP